MASPDPCRAKCLTEINPTIRPNKCPTEVSQSDQNGKSAVGQRQKEFIRSDKVEKSVVGQIEKNKL
jgi:hypothetical protein